MRIVAVAVLAFLVLSVDAGAATKPTRVAGTVWLDSDADGIRDRGERGVRSVNVRLERRVGSRWRRVATLKSSFSGTWSKSKLKAGTYRITITRPASAEKFSPRARGRNRGADSDVTAAGTSTAARLRTGRTLRLDAGLVAAAIAPALGGAGSDGGGGGGQTLTPTTPEGTPTMASFAAGLVWDDLDGDGLRADGEPKLAAVTIEAWDAARSAAVASTTTDIGGRWTLALPSAGSYLVRLVLPNGAIYAPNDAGDDTRDSDIADDGPNAGFTDPTMFGTGTTEISAGVRSNTAAITFGNLVWRDSDADGMQDTVNTATGENGITGRTVELWNDSMTQRLASVTSGGVTEATYGTYSLPAKAGGAYKIKLALPEYESCAPPNTTSDSADSDLFQEPPDACISPTLRPTASTTSFDMGQVERALVGNRVWSDTNGNGIQDNPAEPGVAGVTVEIWNAARTIRYGSTQSNASGAYSVRTPYPGTFRLRVILPAGYKFSPDGLGGDDSLDSDVIDSGVDTGWTYSVVIAPSLISTSVWDAGLDPTP